MNNKPLLEVKDLTISFALDDKDIEITDMLSFDILPGEVFGLVGESGCGKTVTALAMLKLLPAPGGKILSGRVLLKDKNILSLPPSKIRDVRGNDISMIFQEPSSALNPLSTIRSQLNECFDYHEFEGDREARIQDLLKRVGFPEPAHILEAFPHELSGGMLQRVMIAMALVMKPDLIIADEPTTALDVTIQAQIMELMIEMKKETGTSIMLITHNLGLIAQYADRLAVMYAGRIVEQSDVGHFLDNPLHPYTRGLLDALPRLSSHGTELVPIPGQVPQPMDYESGCRFRERCLHAFDPCIGKPDMYELNGTHRVACFLYKGGAS